MYEGWLGEIRLFAGNFAPKNWALCNGSILPINSNQALFAVIGAVYGGDGRTNFALPDLRGRVPVGAGAGTGLTSIPLAAHDGSETNTLTAAHLPPHNHLISADSNTTGRQLASTPAGNYPAQNQDATGNYSATANTTMNAAALANAGGSSPVTNMQPSFVLNYIICTSGYYPPKSY